MTMNISATSFARSYASAARPLELEEGCQSWEDTYPENRQPMTLVFQVDVHSEWDIIDKHYGQQMQLGFGQAGNADISAKAGK